MTAELPPEVPQAEEPKEEKLKLHIGRDTLFVVAGAMIITSAGISPILSLTFVREGLRYIEGRFHRAKEK